MQAIKRLRGFIKDKIIIKNNDPYFFFSKYRGKCRLVPHFRMVPQREYQDNEIEEEL